MEIIEKKITDLKPYPNNPRYNDEAVEFVANSIKEFGFKVPIIVDKNNVIVAGHTRYKACKALNIKKVPCIVADDLSEEQIRAFRLADNKVSEVATYDENALEEELAAVLDIGMEQFGFEAPTFDGFDGGDYGGDYAEDTQERVENILNMGVARFPTVGKYDIPPIYGMVEPPEVTEWVGFNYVLSDENPEGKGVHFFIDDYQFERVWRDPTRYVELLKRYKAVLAPDFSPYSDMPFVLQLFNHYRKHWCAAYWQSQGITVIPTIRASTDPRSFDFFLEGEPRESVVAYSTMWYKDVPEEMKEEYDRMIDGLNPSHILIYGKVLDYMDGENVTRIPSFTEKYNKD